MLLTLSMGKVVITWLKCIIFAVHYQWQFIILLKISNSGKKKSEVSCILLKITIETFMQGGTQFPK